VNEIANMAMLRWLQPRNSLPEPRGSLSSSGNCCSRSI